MFLIYNAIYSVVVLHKAAYNRSMQSFKPWHAYVMLSAGIVMIIGAFIIAFPSLQQSSWRDVTATVTSVEDDEVTRSRRALGSDRTRTVFTPTFEYQVNGRLYVTENPLSVRQSLATGDQVTIRYNPSNPQQAEYGGDQRLLGFTLLLPAFIFIVTSIILLAVYRKKSQATS